MITLSNNKQNKYSNPGRYEFSCYSESTWVKSSDRGTVSYTDFVYKIYLKPCHDHCFLPTYFQNNKKTHNDLARRLFTLKRFQYCRFQNTFQLAFFPSLLSTCRSRLLFLRRKFGVDQRVTINMEVFVPLSGSTSL